MPLFDDDFTLLGAIFRSQWQKVTTTLVLDGLHRWHDAQLEQVRLGLNVLLEQPALFTALVQIPQDEKQNYTGASAVLYF